MVKKINSDIPAGEEITGENIEKTEKAALQPETDKEIEAEIKTDRGTWLETVGAEMPDPKTMQVLRAYPGYESLYVDRQGGAFTPDTAAIIRKGAILYKNPFYEPLKTRR